ncbi:hypothetical protein LCGC14_2798220 [marine sediment metagenome]|uniref:Uncharacterized protein n=1 Tax=marine sediment metagenome TaxID=412755 RepID=A0A0F9BEV8_9ZZZZ
MNRIEYSHVFNWTGNGLEWNKGILVLSDEIRVLQKSIDNKQVILSAMLEAIKKETSLDWENEAIEAANV